MTDFSNRSVLVVDTGGLFLPVARRLALDFGQVYYASEWMERSPDPGRGLLGYGFPGVAHVAEPLAVHPDLVVFPDCSHPALQEHFAGMGVPVWGSREGCQLELDRAHWMALLAELELEVPPHRLVQGVGALEALLKGTESAFVKISKWRGVMETREWRGWDLDQWWLAGLKTRLGPLGEQVEFVVCEPIEGAVEVGVDSYCIDGQWPSTVLHGVEAKDKAYLGRVRPLGEMPEELRDVLEALSGALGGLSYRNWVSIEMRIGGGHAYAIDFTARAGLPSSASQMTLWANWSEIVWAGAQGELVEPEPVAEWSAELAVALRGQPNEWAVCDGGAEALQVSGCCRVGGKLCFPPEPGGHDEQVGWLVAPGATSEEAVEAVLGEAAGLPGGMSVDVAALADVIKTVEAAAEEGAPVGPVPEPAVVLED